MLAAFQKHIDTNHLFTQKDKVLLAVSGGIDSMVMLHLFHQAGYNFGVAHCNFQLRSDESDADEAFAKKQCELLNIPFFSRSFDTKNYATASSLSIQMAARELRYLWFYEILAKEGYSYIATAHHLNDSIETALLNLTRGSGTEGLAGIPLVNGKIIRPLLFATRQEIELYATLQSITWREDSSNKSDNYQRNFIRHHIIPKLKELNPSLEQSIQKSLTKLQGASHIIAWGIDNWKLKNTHQEDDRFLISKSALKEREAVVILFELIRPYGFNWEQCIEVVNTLAGQSGKQFFSSVYKLVIDREYLIIFPNEELMDEIDISLSQYSVQLGPWTLQSELRESSSHGKEKTVAIVDYDKLQFPLRWRKWRPGDSFVPLGMQGHKKLSDFYVDIKLSQADKKIATVLESNGDIVWVVGHRIDDRFKVTPYTKKTVAFTVAPYFV